jgi:hypothetical protein
MVTGFALQSRGRRDARRAEDAGDVNPAGASVRPNRHKRGIAINDAEPRLARIARYEFGNGAIPSRMRKQLALLLRTGHLPGTAARPFTTCRSEGGLTMRKGWLVPFALLGALLLVAGGLLAGRSAVAQDMASPTPMGVDHPAHIHDGTCDALGGVVHPLTNLTAPAMDMGEDMASPMAGDSGDMAMGSPAAGDDMGEMGDDAGGMDMSQVESWSETVVEAALADITGAPHAINVHESTENIQNYVACGEITGTAEGDTLEIALNELNDSGLQGSATLKDNGDGTTTVTVWLWHAEESVTPEASPAM